MKTRKDAAGEIALTAATQEIMTGSARKIDSLVDCLDVPKILMKKISHRRPTNW